MKILYNNRGVALVVLIVAMTLIAVLGASFVSFMGAKQKGFVYQINSYRALNIANGGVEYAIRYISDNISDTSSIYFQNLSISDDIPMTNFATGSFSVVRSFSNTISDDRIEVNGTFQNSSHLVKLFNFRRYVSAITLVSDPAIPLVDRRINMVSISSPAIQIMNNGGTDITLTSIQLTAIFTVSGSKHLQNIYIGDNKSDTSNKVFDGGPTGLEISTPSVPITLSLGNRVIPNTFNKWMIFEFIAGENANGGYTIVFPDASPASTIKF